MPEKVSDQAKPYTIYGILIAVEIGFTYCSWGACAELTSTTGRRIYGKRPNCGRIIRY